MTTLVLLTPATQRAIKAFLADPEKQALLRTPEAKEAYRQGTLRVRRMAAARRASNAVDPEGYREKITI